MRTHGRRGCEGRVIGRTESIDTGISETDKTDVGRGGTRESFANKWTISGRKSTVGA